MRIFIVSQYFWPENFKINDLAQGLSQRGHEVTVLTGQPNYPGGDFFPGYSFFKPRRERLENIEIIRVPLIPQRISQLLPWGDLCHCRGFPGDPRCGSVCPRYGDMLGPKQRWRVWSRMRECAGATRRNSSTCPLNAQ